MYLLQHPWKLFVYVDYGQHRFGHVYPVQARELPAESARRERTECTASGMGSAGGAKAFNGFGHSRARVDY
jgi:D-serine deaminase-like pyridoxal phosphate-dependent protein